MTGPVPCPGCAGRGAYGIALIRRAAGRADIGQRLCPDCGGAGEVSPEKLAAVLAGQERRTERLAARASLNEWAARLGIPPRALNDIEHGR